MAYCPASILYVEDFTGTSVNGLSVYIRPMTSVAVAYAYVVDLVWNDS